MSATQVTRNRLYELLWSKTIKQIAAEYNVRSSDVVKVADGAGIPRPPNGYWTQLACGKACAPVSLPPAEKGESDVFSLTVAKKPYRIGPVKRSTPPDPSPAPTTASDMQTPRHKFVQYTAKALKGQKAYGGDGLISPDSLQPAFNIRVRKESIDRTLAFLDLLAKEAELRSIQVIEVKGDRSTRIGFRASGEEIHFFITERVDRKEIEPGPDNYQFEHVYGVEARWKWADGSTQCIEDLIDGILDSVPHISAEMRRVRLEREKRDRQWKEQEQTRKDQERRAAFEKTRQERLFEHLGSWSNSRELVSFAETAESEADGKDPELLDWLGWVREIARRLDSTQKKVPPWKEWAEHVRRSNDPALRARFFPNDYEWRHIASDLNAGT